MKMALLLIGSTGNTGKYIHELTAARGVPVKRFVRSPIDSDQDVIIGDIRSREDVMRAMEGIDGVISSLSTEGNGTLIAGVNQVIDAMNHYNVQRLVTIGTAGILQSALEPLLFRYQSIENKQRKQVAAMEHHQVYTELLKTNLDWTIICPTKLVEKEQRGGYRIQKDILPANGSEISFADTADFAVAEYFNRAFIHERVGICY